jgi:hypothetical protein
MSTIEKLFQRFSIEDTNAEIRLVPHRQEVCEVTSEEQL